MPLASQDGDGANKAWMRWLGSNIVLHVCHEVQTSKQRNETNEKFKANIYFENETGRVSPKSLIGVTLSMINNIYL